MAVIILDHPVAFPISIVRKALARSLPDLKWQCGEADTGASKESTDFDRPHLIVGRGGDETVMINAEYVNAPWPNDSGQPAPAHAAHIVLSQPTTENAMLARTALLCISAAIILQDGAETARCRVAEGNPWMARADIRHIAEAIDMGNTPSVTVSGADPAVRKAAPAAPPPVSSFAPTTPAMRINSGPDMPQARTPMADKSPQYQSAALGADMLAISEVNRSFANILTEKGMGDMLPGLGIDAPPAYNDEGVQENKLPTMVLLVDRPLDIDWAQIQEFIPLLDKTGNWQFDIGNDGVATVAGHGCTITLKPESKPVPGYLLENAFSRSFWFPDGPERVRVRQHLSQLVISCDLQTRYAPFEHVRHTAMVITALAGMITKQCDLAGLYNAGLETIYNGYFVVQQTAILGDGEIPIMLWTWTAHHSMQEDAISFSTAGVLPFTGFELEAWNAPGTAEFVNEKMSNTLRYLFMKGPVIRQGDTIGEYEGDRSIRCFFGDTRADREKSVKAMFMEFDSLGVTPAVPKADAVSKAPKASPAPPPQAEPSNPNDALKQQARQSPGAIRPTAFGKKRG